MELSTVQGLDINAFNALFSEYQQRFIRFARTYIADATIAEDLVMEGFAAAWEHRDTLNAGAFPSYTLTVIKNKSLNYLRGQAVRLRTAQDLQSHQLRVLDTRVSTLQACDPEELFSEETRRLVDQAVAALPGRTREIFVRSRFRGQSYKEIAAEMDTTVKSVEFEVSKAMKVLRHSLKDYLPALLFIIMLSDS